MMQITKHIGGIVSLLFGSWVVLFTSCSCEDCDPLEFDMYFVNNSFHFTRLEIQFIGELPESIDASIPPNDTLKLQFTEPELEGALFDQTTDIHFTFQSSRDSCIDFSGEIVDFDIDPRSLLSFQMNNSHYEYLIDDSLFAFAGDCEAN